MLSIDEAIANEKEKEEGLREQYEYMMECSDIFRKKKKVFIEQCKHDAEYHEQLAEWLTELKAYREIGTVEECRNSILDIPKAYNRAIDDYVNNCSEYYFNVDDSQSSPYLRNINIISQPNIERIAEQLKEKI